MLGGRERLGMITPLLFAVALDRSISLDRTFCPRDPVPVGYEDTLAVRFARDRKKIEQDFSAIMASILIDRRTNARIGWLVVDDASHEYVVFRKLTDRSIYAAFKPQELRFSAASPYSSPLLFTAPIPPFVKLASCMWVSN